MLLAVVGLAISFGLPRFGGVFAAGLEVSKEAFGEMPDGRPVEKYTLGNIHAMEVSIITDGGASQSIKVPDRDGARPVMCNGHPLHCGGGPLRIAETHEMADF
ncbi:MAG TPA: hypothetical protein VIS99_03895 [Terrimicrobiaceae bacterium]